MKVDNAIIMAAGTSSRFAPLSYEKPKALIEVRGEILIERQIKQIKEAGIDNIIIVTGYKADQFHFLKDEYGVKLVYNPDYLIRNNNSSIYAIKEYLGNSYICSSDNYFVKNPFEKEVDESYYSAVYVAGSTDEWCIKEENGWIKGVKIGGRNSWIMMGHVFWSENFSRLFLSILEEEYCKEDTANKLWEDIYIDHIDELDMKIRKYPDDFIFEFDTLDELRLFDKSYFDDTRSEILKGIKDKLKIEERDIRDLKSFKGRDNSASGFCFSAFEKKYKYFYSSKELREEI